MLESVTARMPMVTWPLSGEQFYNEKLVTRVLRIGVEVGSLVWAGSERETNRPVISREESERAKARLLDGGDEADEMMTRTREPSVMAKRPVEKGGSSYMDLDRLI